MGDKRARKAVTQTLLKGKLLGVSECGSMAWVCNDDALVMECQDTDEDEDPEAHATAPAPAIARTVCLMAGCARKARNPRPILCLQHHNHE